MNHFWTVCIEIQQQNATKRQKKNEQTKIPLSFLLASNLIDKLKNNQNNQAEDPKKSTAIHVKMKLYHEC